MDIDVDVGFDFDLDSVRPASVTAGYLDVPTRTTTSFRSRGLEVQIVGPIDFVGVVEVAVGSASMLAPMTVSSSMTASISA